MAIEETRLMLLIDDEPAQSRSVSALAAREGWRTLVVASGDVALERLASLEGAEIGAVLLDQRVPGEDACELVRGIRALRPDIPLLMLTASTSPLLAVEAMRSGATDYLIKPVAPDRLLAALRSATRAEAPRDELQPMTEKLQTVLDFDAMVGTEPPFRTALARAATAARGHGHVLVEGESGTGKEMLMRATHAASTRAKTAMKLVECGSIPSTSLESLLFGHEKGAFAGAFDRQLGLLETCDGGTLLLDDIDRMDRTLQDRLAQVIETPKRSHTLQGYTCHTW